MTVFVDGANWRCLGANTRLVCGDCGLEYPQPDPRLFSFNSPLGACPECEGFGNIVDVDMDLVVPDEQKSIREGRDRSLEHAGLRPRARRVGGAGQGLWTADGRPFRAN